MTKFFSVVILMCIVFTQVLGQNNSKTIWNKYAISPYSCKYKVYKLDDLSAPKPSAPPPPRPTAPAPRIDETATIDELFAGYQTFLQEQPKEHLKRIELSENLVAFNKNGKWGFKDGNGKVLYQPQYDFIRPVKKEGILAYKNGKCRYIDRTNGTMPIKKEYYYIEWVIDDVYLIRAKTGLGVLKGQEEVIKPIHKDIVRYVSDGRFYFVIDRVVSVLDDFKTVLPTTSSVIKYIKGDRYVWTGSDLFDTKEGKQLICDNIKLRGQMKLLSQQHGLFSITDNKKRDYHLIDVNGNILSDQIFIKLYETKYSDLIIGGIKEGKIGEKVTKVGLIDHSGAWKIKPLYKKIYATKAGQIRVVTFEGKDLAVDGEGKPINASQVNYPEAFDQVKRITDQVALGIYNKDGVVASKIFNLETKEIIKDNLDYTEIKYQQRRPDCDQYIYEAKTKKGRYVLNRDFEKVTPMYARFGFRMKRFLSGKNKVNGLYHYTLFDCNGEKLTVDFYGEELDVFNIVKEVDDHLTYVSTPEGYGYFIQANGETQLATNDLYFFSKSGIGDFYLNAVNISMPKGVINDKGEVIISNELKELILPHKFSKFTCFSTYDNQGGILDENGKLAGKLYELVERFPSSWGGFFLTLEKNKRGIINYEGRELVTPKFDGVYYYFGIIIAKIGNQEYWYDLEGNLLN